MKSIKLFIAILVVLLMVPVSSYALVDFGAYGGYALGNIETDAAEKDLNGYEFGAFAHYTTGLPMLFSIGIGGFYQRNVSKYELNNTDYDATRSMYGADLMFTVELPIVIHPFVRGGIAINESFDIDFDEEVSESESFKSYYVAVGAGITVFPMIRLFGEYMYNKSEQESEQKINTSSFHIGAMLSI